VPDAAADIEATAAVAAPPEDVFEFLCDLDNHWRLVDRAVEVLELSGEPPDRATVRLRGPAGVRRTVHTRVTESHAPSLIVGEAELSGGTRARVTWTLAPDGGPDATRVQLAARVGAAAPLDRLLLALGGRIWLRRRFGFGLERLGERFAATPSPSPTPPLSPAPAESSSRPTPS
jgi:uncharacterized protein YndB with AHSA1/START domain